MRPGGRRLFRAPVVRSPDVTRPPPFPSLRAARIEQGVAGVRALVAWVAEEHPPGRSTLSAAAVALGAGAGLEGKARADAVRAAVDALRRASKLVSAPLPEYPRGTAAGHPSHATRPKRGADDGPRKPRAPKTKPAKKAATKPRKAKG